MKAEASPQNIELSYIELSIIIPVYNNSGTLIELIEQVDAACKLVSDDFEIILIDDGSRDESWNLISSLKVKSVNGLRLSRNFGQQSALKAGFSEARGQYIIMMDADLEENPSVIPDIVAELRSGFDICYTAYPDTMKKNGRRTSRLFHRLVSVIAKNDNTPNIATMRGFKRGVLDGILRHGERRPVYGPLIVGLGFTSTTLDVDMPETKGKESSYNFRKRVSLAMDYLIGYTNLPAIFFLIAGGASFLLTTIYAAVIVIQYLIIGNQLPPGISLLMFVMLLMFSMLFFGIGIVGLYLHRLLAESLDRPLYLISERSGLENKSTKDDTFKEVSNVRRD